MKTKSLCLILLSLFFVETVFGQDNSTSKTQYHLDLSYTNPFQKDNNFIRIGSILGIKGGLTFQLEKDKFIGFDASSSIFFPNGGGEPSKPKILPQGRIKFSNSDKLWSDVSFGALYNPSSIGYELNFSYSLSKPDKAKNIWSLYLNGVSQTFNNSQNEYRTNAPISSLGLIGIKYITPIAKDLMLIIKPGVGVRGDSDMKSKIVGNISTVFVWKYFSAVAAYTNKVPEQGFPSYFVVSGGVDVAKIIYDLKPKSRKKSTKNLFFNSEQENNYHQNVLSY